MLTSLDLTTAPTVTVPTVMGRWEKLMKANAMFHALETPRPQQSVVEQMHILSSVSAIELFSVIRIILNIKIVNIGSMQYSLISATACAGPMGDNNCCLKY